MSALVTSAHAVIVVGAGPVGLTLAIGLRAHGVDVRVIEARPGPAPEVRASHVHARVLEALEGHGVTEALVARGSAHIGADVLAGGRVLSSIALEDVETRWPYSLAIPQPDVEEVLAERLLALGGTIERGVTVTGVRQDAQHVDLETSAGPRRARWVIGCDGASSAVRAAIGVKLVGKALKVPLALADVITPESMRITVARLHTGPDGIAFRVPLRDGERVVVELPEGMAPSAESVLSTARARIPDLGPLPQPAWVSTFKLHRLIADRFRVGRVFLAGDAAHLHSPVGGHGMNTGLLDAVHLGWRLAWIERGLASATILDSYEPERRPSVALSVWQAWGMAQALRIRRWPFRWFRDFAVWSGDLLPPLRRRIARWVLEMDADAISWFGGARAGRRAPDVQIDGRWLLEPLRGRLGVLTFGDPVPAEVISRFGDALAVIPAPSHEAIHRAYGTGGLVVVRPDGLIGYRGPAAGLAAWLARFAPAP